MPEADKPRLVEYWTAKDVCEASDRKLVIETIRGCSDIGMLLTLSSTVSTREATIILSNETMLALAQKLSDDFGPVKMPRKD